MVACGLCIAESVNADAVGEIAAVSMRVHGIEMDLSLLRYAMRFELFP
jgi:hypothetical protein